MNSRNRIALDVAVFIAVVVAYAPYVTGVAVHEWLSVAIIVPTLVHLVVNWDQVTRVSRRMAARLSTATAANLAVDAALFLSAVTVMVSGLAVSQVVGAFFGMPASASALWHTVHSVSADATVLALLVHFALHARWMAGVVQGRLNRLEAVAATATGRPTPSTVRSPS